MAVRVNVILLAYITFSTHMSMPLSGMVLQRESIKAITINKQVELFGLT